MAAKADPLSEVRRDNFRDYARRKGWQNDNGTWATTAISKAVGKPTNKVSDLLNGKGSFGAAIARDIEEACHDLRPGELDGLGGAAAEGEFVAVRRADVKFSNGTGAVVYYEDDKPPLSFRRDFLQRIGIPPGRAVVVEAAGISNEPKIIDGAVVLVNTADRERLNGDFFAFRADGELLIKRLEPLDGIGVLATAENPNYKPKTRIYKEGVDDWEVIGRAVWTGSTL